MYIKNKRANIASLQGVFFLGGGERGALYKKF